MISNIWGKRNILTFIGIVFSIIGIYFCNIKFINEAIIMMILAGICDAFDGFIAKKINNDDTYGIQLDSLSDIISSGILPISLCLSMGYDSFIDIGVYIIFIICGITRLAYYNVNSSNDKCFVGLPITCSTILIPLLYIIIKNEIIFMLALLILSISFITNIKIPKPSLRMRTVLSIMGLIVIGLICALFK